MPAMTKDKFVAHVQTPIRVHSRSLGHHDVKRLGPSRKITTKQRIQTQSIQTQTVLASIILNNTLNRCDEGTQTTDDLSTNEQRQTDGLTTRLFRFLGGQAMAFMNLFTQMK